MNEIATIGHNSPPDPISDAIAPYDDAIAEAQNWLDGEPVENEGQMKVVDALLTDIKAAKKAVSIAEESAAKPLYDRWKEEKAKFSPTITDLDRIAKGLASIVGDFKKKLAAEKAEAQRLAALEARKKAEEAERAAREARAGDIESQRRADAAHAEMEAARKAESAAKKEKVKGLRTVVKYEVTDRGALLSWIAKYRRPDLEAIIDEWARSNFRNCREADGLRVWEEKEAF